MEGMTRNTVRRAWRWAALPAAFTAGTTVLWACDVTIPAGPAARGANESDAGYPTGVADDGGLQDASGAPGALRPSFGATVTASVPPPPISGGTLLVTRDGRWAIASDPDRDLVYGVDLGSRKVTWTASLSPGDEPGRLAEDGAGRVHVALRHAGALVTLNEATGALIARTPVCPAPRGVAWDDTRDVMWVACATGELVALPSGGGAPTQSFVVERDLRDVIVNHGSLTVTTFRSAQVLRLASDGTIARRDALPSPRTNFESHVAWRAVPGPGGTLVTVHQMETTSSLTTSVQGAYGAGGCGGEGGGPIPQSPFVGDDGGAADAGIDGSAGDAGAAFDASCPPLPPPDPGDAGLCIGSTSSAVDAVVTVLAGDGTSVTTTALGAVLPVDVAISSDGSSIAVVAPGNAYTSALPTVFQVSPCGSIEAALQTSTGGVSAQPIAVGFDPAGDLLVQTREPAELWIRDAVTRATSTVPLSSLSRADTGLDVYHTQAGGLIACASCHPEGGDDGFVWRLDGNQRRTPSLRGTVAGTAPYHWPGDQPSLDALVDDVYTVRMNGATLAAGPMGALTGWVQTIPAPPAPSWVDASAAQRGQALFSRVDVGCATCHSGPKLTDNLTVNVGTGGAFQVPPLVGVGWRTPLLHDGCAATIADRFGACATPQHGSTGALSAQDISDLGAYLETL